ncbi:GNAT family N-acetyltransferase [Autumnicola edwardsiae]|uniref:GNAT family N-acetyltransferase n=1 Tax=Autumnicola edwardsiae TaxID=3075594 RepID=A0ABU3CV15_9FLAO|nr:GNAT family N-acetyltransferase [Zunongwangia sp. F297]MDT0649750.1 GNAT family N-acetyltransferase [Zunongwangia sp. F297]
MNGFLFDDAQKYTEELLATTFVIQSSTETVAYFNYLNDKISHHEIGNKEKFIKRISSLLPIGKDGFTSYPAVKIGRLAVSKQYKGKGFGREILNFTKQLFVDNNRTGCKFITVDAYRESLKFYEKNGFKYLSSRDVKSDTRLMYFNLEAIN